ncbi:MAG: hypothetical protein QM621_08275 [Aeromicrobium sp.]|uniref:hypothetical protein n=1 Tax=Aeromicrobium sp. TaxID=1871063 RepID=UPI0039E68B7E
MTDVMPTSEVGTRWDAVAKRVRAGETVYIGEHGEADMVLSPAPKRRRIRLGVLAHRRDPAVDLGSEDLIGPDPEVWEEFFASMDADEPAG